MKYKGREAKKNKKTLNTIVGKSNFREASLIKTMHFFRYPASIS